MTFLIILPSQSLASENKILATQYTRIFYNTDKSLTDFIWRISGRKISLYSDLSPAKNSVDAIVERVQAILDMFPGNFHIDIVLYPSYKSGYIASYNHSKKAIYLYADRITDGVLAHEIAHAIINAYFDSPPPKKMQEILTQYVDRHLWSDY